MGVYQGFGIPFLFTVSVKNLFSWSHGLKGYTDRYTARSRAATGYLEDVVRSGFLFLLAYVVHRFTILKH